MPIFVAESRVPLWTLGEGDEVLKPGAGGFRKVQTTKQSCDPPLACALLPLHPLFFFFLAAFSLLSLFLYPIKAGGEGEGESGTRQTDIMGLNPAQLFSQQPSPSCSQGNKCSSGGSWCLMMV